MDIYSRISNLLEKKDKIIFIFCTTVISTATIAGVACNTPYQTDNNPSFLEEGISFDELLPVFNGNTFIPVAEPSSESKVIKFIPVIVTAYSSTPWETWGDPFITAAGTTVRDGIVANNLLPFGTEVRIPELYGEEIFVVEDRMNSKKGYYHIDIWFPSYPEALSFGAKKTYIEVLEG
jgi:3D (Asp-Asp-Asp) domain-containing protein